jgi:hypothetical protein
MSNKQYIRAVQLVRQLVDEVATLNHAVAEHAAVVGAQVLTARCAAVRENLGALLDVLADDLGEVVAIDDDDSERVEVVPTVVERRRTPTVPR